MKKLLVLLFLIPSLALAQPTGTDVIKPNPKIGATSGKVEIYTQAAKQIDLLVNIDSSAKGWYIDGTTGVFTSVGGATIGSSTLASPTISGNLTFSTAAAKIIPGATSLTFRNNADSGSNIVITDAGVITLRDNLINSTSGKGIFLGATAVSADAASGMISTPLQYTFTTGNSQASFMTVHGQANAGGAQTFFAKSRATDGSADTIVQNNDSLYSIGAFGADGANFISGGYINFEIDGTPGPNDLPVRIVFKVTPDGSSNTAEVLRLSNDKTALFSGDVAFATNKTISIQEATAGTACSGTLTANGATPVVTSTTCALTGSRIFLTRTSAETGTVTAWRSALSNGVSFSITSEAADTGTYDWFIIHEAA